MLDRPSEPKPAPNRDNISRREIPSTDGSNLMGLFFIGFMGPERLIVGADLLTKFTG